MPLEHRTNNARSSAVTHAGHGLRKALQSVTLTLDTIGNIFNRTPSAQPPRGTYDGSRIVAHRVENFRWNRMVWYAEEFRKAELHILILPDVPTNPLQKLPCPMVLCECIVKKPILSQLDIRA